MTDKERDLESLIAESLLLADSIGHAVIQVEEIEGTITLKGMVESEQDRLNAEALAQALDGVQQVVNKLKIAGRRGGYT